MTMKTSKRKKSAGKRTIVLHFENVGAKGLLFYMKKAARMSNSSDSCCDYELNVFANINAVLESDCITIASSRCIDSGDPNDWWDRPALKNFDGPCDRMEYMAKVRATLDKWASRRACTNTDDCPFHTGAKAVSAMKIEKLSDTAEDITIELPPWKNRY